MASPYLDFNGLKLRTIMPSEDVDAVESSESGWVGLKLIDWSDEIDARLRKRYAVPFGTEGTGADAGKRVDVPPTVIRWLVALVNRDLYFKRGASPSGALDKEAILGMAEKVEAEIKEASDSKDGLFDLPLKASETASGISKGGPKAYIETSPYVWTDVQVEAGKTDDERGAGV